MNALITRRPRHGTPITGDVNFRDVNFVFLQKIDYRFEENRFFSIIEFGRRYLAMLRSIRPM